MHYNLFFFHNLFGMSSFHHQNWHRVQLSFLNALQFPSLRLTWKPPINTNDTSFTNHKFEKCKRKRFEETIFNSHRKITIFVMIFFICHFSLSYMQLRLNWFYFLTLSNYMSRTFSGSTIQSIFLVVVKWISDNTILQILTLK